MTLLRRAARALARRATVGIAALLVIACAPVAQAASQRWHLNHEDTDIGSGSCGAKVIMFCEMAPTASGSGFIAFEGGGSGACDGDLVLIQADHRAATNVNFGAGGWTLRFNTRNFDAGEATIKAALGTIDPDGDFTYAPGFRFVTFETPGNSEAVDSETLTPTTDFVVQAGDALALFVSTDNGCRVGIGIDPAGAMGNSYVDSPDGSASYPTPEVAAWLLAFATLAIMAATCVGGAKRTKP